MSDKAITQALMADLERHYIKPGEAYAGGLFIPECGVNGAWGAGSRCDALYVGFTAASGRLLVGHEVKASRSDWRRELDKVGKADAWADQCHAWYVVAPDIATVRPEELPHDWGLMIPTGRGRMKVVVKAPVRADRAPSWEALRSIMARIDTLQRQAVTQLQIDANQRAQKQAEATLEHERQARPVVTPEQAERLRTLDRLEQLTGLKIRSWIDDPETEVRIDDLARALVLQANLRQQHRPLTIDTERVRRVALDLAESLATWDGLVAELGEIVEGRPGNTPSTRVDNEDPST